MPKLKFRRKYQITGQIMFDGQSLAMNVPPDDGRERQTRNVQVNGLKSLKKAQQKEAALFEAASLL